MEAVAAMNYDKIAWLYDSYANGTFDVPFFLEECRKTQGNVLELTCGTGRLSIPLIEAGVSLTCADNSQAMLDVFRTKLNAKGLHAELSCQDMAAFSFKKTFDLIFIPFHSFAECVTPEAQVSTLQCIREHLAPGGRFICTLHNPIVRAQRADGRSVLVGTFPVKDTHNTLALWSAERYDPETGLVTGGQFYEIYDADGRMESRFMVDLRFALHTIERFSAMAEGAGFAETTVYGDYHHTPFDAAASPVIIWEGCSCVI